ncbi:helix-turn-helix transcriptional regulator [Phytohabitans sp. ZYX-F-186]|uniref:Helix-turn-helix transcriptional regulator n=1 Tax=Phytohabitans maris TaxID=3071409 RepID=A0ABU0ZVY6_9ACTN|nr:helix-turn-helix transcriptional regulator [Phytohabitans sp. ZYX-F-186]MDQ7911194.1 helix-turn-helix transcriptional regulator [Phytohabitans sp. ZYX-F-186]
MPTDRKQFLQTVRAQYLGSRMRQLREERGLTLKYIAAYLGVEFSTLARYERAEWPFRRDHVIALLDVYGVYDDATRTALVDMAHQAWRINQWVPAATQPDNARDAGGGGGGTVVDDWWVQQRAEELCIYANLTIPQVVQARDYATAIIAHTVPQQPLVDKLVRQLVERQQALEVDRKPETRLEILLEEPVLHRPVGGRLVLQAQLQHLARLLERPHINVRILPTRIGWHPGLHGAFTLCTMQRPYPPVALVHHLDGHLMIEADAAQRYKNAFDKLREVSLSPAESAALIATTAEET